MMNEAFSWMKGMATDGDFVDAILTGNTALAFELVLKEFYAGTLTENEYTTVIRIFGLGRRNIGKMWCSEPDIRCMLRGEDRKCTSTKHCKYKRYTQGGHG